MPGHADGAITVSLGYGREAAGKVGGNPEHQLGFNAYKLRTSDHLWFAPGLTVRKTWEIGLLACTQQHHLMENREHQSAPAPLQDYRDDPRFATKKEEEEEKAQTQRGVRKPLTMYDQWPYKEDDAGPSTSGAWPST